MYRVTQKKTVVTKIWLIFEVLFIWLQNFTYISNMFSSRKLTKKLSLYFKKSLIYKSSKMCSKWATWQCLVFRRCLFSVVGSCKIQKQYFWGKTSPDYCLKWPLHSLKCTACVAIFKHGINGEFRFEDDNEHCVTIDTYSGACNFCTALGRRKVRVRQ